MRIDPFCQPSGDLIVVDTQGALVVGRSGQNIYKQAIAGLSNNNRKTGKLEEVIVGADAVIGGLWSRIDLHLRWFSL